MGVFDDERVGVGLLSVVGKEGYDLGFRVLGLGFRVYGLGLRV